MRKWEYWVAELHPGDALVTVLDDYGDYGWELVSATATEKAVPSMILIFKRPKK